MSELILQKNSEFKSFLEKNKQAIKDALPEHITPERMIRLALTTLNLNPALKNCTASSILGAIVTSSQLGLEIGVLGQAYLVPYWDYKNKTTIATLIPGWQGLMSLLSRCGNASAWTGAVYNGDKFNFKLGTEPTLEHEPGDSHGLGELTHVYAIGKIKGVEIPIIECWSIERIRKHRDLYNKSKDKEKHYSFNNEEMYARKVVLLQVLKYLPKSIELENAVAYSNIQDGGGKPTFEDGVVFDAERDVTPQVEVKSPKL